jgi:hypothetical protein
MPQCHLPQDPAHNRRQMRFEPSKLIFECYEKNQVPLANDNLLQALFTDQDTIDRVKAASTLSKDDGKKLVLPDVVPGFKASSLEVGKCPFPPYLPHAQRHCEVFFHFLTKNRPCTRAIGPACK